MLDDHENDEDNVMALEGHSNMPVYAAPILMQENELNEKIRSLHSKTKKNISVIFQVGQNALSKTNQYRIYQK